MFRRDSIGIDLKEVRVVGDEAAQIIGAARALASDFDHVFTSGGIGPTHDDITADCIAEAFGQGISIRDDARKLLTDAYSARGVEVTEARLRMARIPDDATLIENPVSTAPGFTVENVHVMAGVPKVFEAMVSSVLPTLTGYALAQPDLARGNARRRDCRPIEGAGRRIRRPLLRIVALYDQRRVRCQYRGARYGRGAAGCGDGGFGGAFARDRRMGEVGAVLEVPWGG